MPPHQTIRTTNPEEIAEGLQARKLIEEILSRPPESISDQGLSVSVHNSNGSKVTVEEWPIGDFLI